MTEFLDPNLHYMPGQCAHYNSLKVTAKKACRAMHLSAQMGYKFVCKKLMGRLSTGVINQILGSKNP